MRSIRAQVTSLAVLFGMSGCLSDGEPPSPSPTRTVQDEIVQGTVVEGCGWPVTVAVGNGCSGALVHPSAVTTAVHCGPGPGTIVRIGPTLQSPARSVVIAACVNVGTDAAICELEEAVSGVPVTPIIYGCEAQQYLTVGQPVVYSGFGVTQFGGPIDGQKRWAAQTIEAVFNDRVVVGEAGVLPSPCPGDSGGPVHVRIADGSWRVIGSLLGGTTGVPCNSAAAYHRSDVVVAAFEQSRGLDITPCFDAVTGAWEPSAACTGFYAGDENGTDTWSNLCAAEPRSGPSQSCGAPPSTGEGGGPGQGGGPGDGGDAGDGGATGDGVSNDDHDDDDDGSTATASGCAVIGGGGAPCSGPWSTWGLMLALLMGSFKRRRGRRPSRITCRLPLQPSAPATAPREGDRDPRREASRRDRR
ncbi:MAG: trypsin-like serine protease [Myxococcota bacterium]